MKRIRNSYWAIGILIIAVAGLSGCAGGYGGGESSDASYSDTPAFKAETAGQQFLLERTQARDEMSRKTEQSDAPTPESAAKKACSDFPGFDRGCPGK